MLSPGRLRATVLRALDPARAPSRVVSSEVRLERWAKACPGEEQLSALTWLVVDLRDRPLGGLHRELVHGWVLDRSAAVASSDPRLEPQALAVIDALLVRADLLSPMTCRELRLRLEAFGAPAARTRLERLQQRTQPATRRLTA